jgi:hypothetical protein
VKRLRLQAFSSTEPAAGNALDLLARLSTVRLYAGLEESDDLPEPEVLAQEIADDMQTAFEQFSAIAVKLKG